MRRPRTSQGGRQSAGTSGRGRLRMRVHALPRWQVDDVRVELAARLGELPQRAAGSGRTRGDGAGVAEDARDVELSMVSGGHGVNLSGMLRLFTQLSPAPLGPTWAARTR